MKVKTVKYRDVFVDRRDTYLSELHSDILFTLARQGKNIMSYWLLKSEPDTFSIDDLEKRPQKIAPWDGVRNYQARNFLKAMKKGDQAFFYHSSCKIPGIAGWVEVVKEAYQEIKEDPRWVCVDVKLIKKFPEVIALTALRNMPSLKEMILLRKGNRLSVTPVRYEEWTHILQTLSEKQ